MKRRNIGPSISFFAFQDIITAVVGIFILILLILVLELTQRVEAASKPPSHDVDGIQSTIESLRNESERLQTVYESRLADQATTVDVNEFNRKDRVDALRVSLNAATGQLQALNEQAEETESRIEELKQTQDQLQIESAELEDERDLLAELKQALDRIEQTTLGLKSVEGVVYRDTTAEGRFLTIVSLDSRGIQMKDAATKSTSVMTARQFEQWLTPSKTSSRHFLVLISPSGAGRFDSIREMLVDEGCVYGFDVMAEGEEPQLSFEWDLSK